MDVTGEALKSEPELRIVPSAEDLARAAAEDCLRLAMEAVSCTRPLFDRAGGWFDPETTLCAACRRAGEFLPRHVFPGRKRISSGETSGTCRRTIRTATIEWPSKQCFRRFLSPPRNLHRIEGENPDASKAAENYEQDLVQHFHLSPGTWPQFDLVLLGLGSRRSHRLAFSRHRRSGRNGTTGCCCLGSKVSRLAHHAHSAAPEPRLSHSLSRQREGQI